MVCYTLAAVGFAASAILALIDGQGSPVIWGVLAVVFGALGAATTTRGPKSPKQERHNKQP